ncbi:MAG: DISARM system phospholipase D-like protein DrmC [Candidatus Sericytochromatia bacterium]
MPDALADILAGLVQALPSSLVTGLSETLRKAATPQNQLMHQQLLSDLGPELQPAIKSLLKALQEGSVTPEALALALETSSRVADHFVRTQSVELVWTGPRSGVPTRQTGQVVREVIRSARQNLWIMSFTIRDIAELKSTLDQALAQGLSIRLVIEHKQEADGTTMEAKSRQALAEIGLDGHPGLICYIWPPFQRREQRRRDQQIYLADALHAKCLLADQQKLFITSANLTRSALNDNMELGVLLTGGPHPRSLHQHFHQLVEQGVLHAIPQP